MDAEQSTYVTGYTRSDSDFPLQGFYGGGTEADVGENYRYPVTADDAEGDALSFSLTVAPEGMVIDVATGLITWTPDSSGAVALSVDDGQGETDTQSYIP